MSSHSRGKCTVGGEIATQHPRTATFSFQILFTLHSTLTPIDFDCSVYSNGMSAWGHFQDKINNFVVAFLNNYRNPFYLICEKSRYNFIFLFCLILLKKCKTLYSIKSIYMFISLHIYQVQVHFIQLQVHLFTITESYSESLWVVLHCLYSSILV